MPRNLIVCCDGTSNQPGEANTNVLRLYQALAEDPARQLAFYDPGVGTLPEPTWHSKIAKKISELGGLAFGWGLTRNVEEAYTFLMRTWEPGDRVFLFGFSRGAYTVRVLASLLHQVGLLRPGQEPLLPYALRLFNAIRGEGAAPGGGGYWNRIGTFRNDFGRDVGRHTRHFPVHFLGAWDTVSSYGRVWDPRPFPFTRSNPSVEIVRHAVALDERRWFFQQNLFQPTQLTPPAEGAARPAQDLVERWFPGVHADIGGGYEDESQDADPGYARGLWRVGFEWLLAEATAKGLLTDPDRLARARRPMPIPAEPWLGRKHESLRGWWWLAQFFPKLTWDSKTRRKWPRIGGVPGRRNPAGAVLQAAVLRRVRADATYRPPNLPPATIQEIFALPAVHDDTTVTVPAG